MSKLKIAATRDGFRRAGRAWTKEPQTVDASEFTEEQIEQLKADPNIFVAPARAKPAAPVIPAEVRTRSIGLAVEVLGARKEKPLVPAIRALTGIVDVSGEERDAAVAALAANEKTE